jgi:hypothetical protein
MAEAKAGFSDGLTIQGGTEQTGSSGVLWFDTLLTFNVRTEREARGIPVSNAMAGHVSVVWDVRSPNASFPGGGCSFAAGSVSPTGTLCDGFKLSGGAGGDCTAHLRSGMPLVFGQPFSLALPVIRYHRGQGGPPGHRFR